MCDQQQKWLRTTKMWPFFLKLVNQSTGAFMKPHTFWQHRAELEKHWCRRRVCSPEEETPDWFHRLHLCRSLRLTPAAAASAWRRETPLTSVQSYRHDLQTHHRPTPERACWLIYHRQGHPRHTERERESHCSHLAVAWPGLGVEGQLGLLCPSEGGSDPPGEERGDRESWFGPLLSRKTRGIGGRQRVELN